MESKIGSLFGDMFDGWISIGVGEIPKNSSMSNNRSKGVDDVLKSGVRIGIS